jgi:hypothetical protein
MDVASWCAEVINLGDIVQDGDDSVSDEERERRFYRYVERVASVTGEEADGVFGCLLASVRDQDDYGAHETVLSAPLRFPAERRGRLAASNLADAIQRIPDFAGDLLGQFALGPDDAVAALNDSIAALPQSQQDEILEFVACEEEGDGWLSSPRQKGRIRVP